jgi:hydroxymethylpyrimidine/phosphomethylpyrimidine kinase
MARGCDIVEAISKAKEFVTEALQSGADVAIGRGNGPVNHGFNPQKMIVYDNE